MARREALRRLPWRLRYRWGRRMASNWRRGMLLATHRHAEVEIGAGCIFSWNTIVQCTTTVTFENDVVLSTGVLVVDGNHRFRDPDTHFLRQGYNFRPIHFGYGALVLAQSVVIADVGERAVVGANSVVTKPVPPYCLAIGTPAEVVEYFGPPELRPEGLAL